MCHFDRLPVQAQVAWGSCATYVHFETQAERVEAPSLGESSSYGIAKVQESKPNHQVMLSKALVRSCLLTFH